MVNFPIINQPADKKQKYSHNQILTEAIHKHFDYKLMQIRNSYSSNNYKQTVLWWL